MHKTLWNACMAMALATMLVCGATAASAGETLPLGTSPEIPAATGDIRLRVTQNGNTEFRLRISNLAPPGRIVSGSDVFVVWVRSQAPGAEAQNMGALKVDKKLNAKFTGATALSSFGLFITCETSQTVTTPSLPELLPFSYAAK